MRIADPARSRAVLIGTARYRHAAIDDLPSVAVNLDRLGELLRDPAVWGLPAEHCVALLEPKSCDVALDAVRAAAQSASDTLVVYFAGHGLLDPGGDLLLGMPASDPQIPYRSLRYDDLRRQVLEARRCPSKVVILDCCFSGRAMAGGMSSMMDLADHAAVDGSSLLTAAAETKLALAPPEETYTAFTGELIRLLEEGIAGGPPLLSVDSLFWRMHGELMAKGRPIPQQRFRNAGSRIIFVRNRWSRAGASAPVEAVEPAAPVELAAAPAGVVADLARLRALGQGDAASAVLVAVGRQWPDQRVAAMLSLLITADRPADIALVFDGLSGRDSPVVYHVLELLLGEFGPASVAALMIHLAEWLPERAAQLVCELRASATLGVLVGGLIEGFVAAAVVRPHRVIDLITGLFVRSDPVAAEQVIAAVSASMTGKDLTLIADALREAGREAAAFALYGMTVDVLADRPPAQLAAIARGLRAYQQAAAAVALLLAAVARRRDAAARADVIMAFAVKGLLGVELGDIAVALTDDEVVRLSDLLRERQGMAEAVALVTMAAQRRSAGSAARLVNALVAQGWPGDALHVIAAASPGRTAAEVDLLTRTVDDTPRRGRTRAAFAALAAEPPDRLAELCARLDTADPVRLKLLQSELAARPETAVGVVVALAQAGRARLAEELLLAVDDGELLVVLGDLATARWAIRCAVEGDARAVAERIIGIVRSAEADRRVIFALAGQLARRGLAGAAESLLADRLWLPAERVKDGLAAAVAEALHLALPGDQHIVRYPVDEVLVRRLTAARLLSADEVCLLVCAWPSAHKERLLVFTDRGIAHSEHPLVRYRDLCALPSIVVLGGAIHLMPDVDSGVPAAHWTVAAGLEERQTAELIRLVRTVVLEVQGAGEIT